MSLKGSLKGKKNGTKSSSSSSLLLSTKKAAPPPTETTRLFASILDGKSRPKKRLKKSSFNAAAAATNTGKQASTRQNDHTGTQNGWSRLSTTTTRTPSSSSSVFHNKPANAEFGAQKGLASLPQSRDLLKRKRSDSAKNGLKNHSLKITTTKDISRKDQENKHANAATRKNSKKTVANSSASCQRTRTITGRSNPSTSIPANTSDSQLKSVQTSGLILKSKKLVGQGNHKQESTKNELERDHCIGECQNLVLPRQTQKQRQSLNNKAKEQNDLDLSQQTAIQNLQPKTGNIEKKSAIPNKQRDAKESTEEKSPLNLGFTLANHAGKRGRQTRSLSQTMNSQSQDLAVLGAMLSSTSATSSATGTTIPTKTAIIDSTRTSKTVATVTYDKHKDFMEHSNTKPARLLPPMRPLIPADVVATTNQDDLTTSVDGSKENQKQSQRNNKPRCNDNYIRLNLRNSAGSCRGARNKKTRKRSFDRYRTKNNMYYRNNESDDDMSDTSPQDRRPPKRGSTQRAESFRAGVDPLDDFLDGVLHGSQTKTTTGPGEVQAKVKANSQEQATAPQCTRHQRPCKLLTVKKTGTGNKGRKFYCCSMPRGEQCDHFQWADDTIEAAKMILLKNSSHSGFIARQVAAYSERFKKLTVPELREIANRRKLDPSGKKQQLLLRLSLWVRDELASVAPKTNDKNDDDAEQVVDAKDDDLLVSYNVDVSGLEPSVDDDDGSSCSSSSSSDDELEIFHSAPGKTQKDFNDQSNESNTSRDASCQSTKPPLLKMTNSSSSFDSEADEEATPASKIQATLTSLFGYTELRDGQEWAIQRCLQKEKSLLVAPTGFGKSMCYVIPAALMDGVCIVVSPLISLIQDQLRELPPRVPAATLSGSLTAAATAAIIDDVIRKRIKVLFVSPERLASASFQRLFRTRWNKDSNSLERPFPSVSLLCIDEAHCLSQWAHNFRPSYLRLRSLVQKIGPQSVLAITATASRPVVADICRTLGIAQCNSSSCVGINNRKERECRCGVLTMKTDRDNIDVKSFVVPTQEMRLSMLVKLLKPASKSSQNSVDSGFSEGCLTHGSVIVYVWRQRDAEVVAESIQASGVSGGVVFYHGGMDSGARSNAYSKFMRGKARICVATVAFGLGVNKPDIRGVVHVCLPASPEHFVQEAGRAGRDGKKAKAIALVLEEEALVRHSQAHSDLISQSQLRAIIFSFRKIVQETIGSIDCEHWSQIAAAGVAIPLNEFSTACDCKPETIETIFSLLELREENDSPSVMVEGITIDQVTISLKRRKLSKLAETEPVAKVIQQCGLCVDAPAGEKDSHAVAQIKQSGFGWDRQNSRHQQFAAYSFGSYRFSVTKIANMLGPAAQPRHVFAAMRRLQFSGEIELTLDKTATGTALRVILNNSGLRMVLAEEDHDILNLAKSLAEDMNSIANASALKVLDITMMMHKVADAVKGDTKGGDTSDDEDEGKSKSLALFQELTSRYFSCKENETLAGDHGSLPNFANNCSDNEILIDAMAIVSDLSRDRQSPVGEFALELGHPDSADYTALTISKFLHGMAMVRAPAAIYRHHRLYGKWQACHFGELLKRVQRVLTHATKAS